MAKYVLQEYYIRYLRDIKKLKEETVKHYQYALNNISNFLKREGKIDQTIYEVLNIEELQRLKDFLDQNDRFTGQNQKGHRMYSAGLNHYLNFANGEKFEELQDNFSVLDVAMPIAQKSTGSQTVWKRSNIIKKQAIRSANYQCEVDAAHETFIAKSTKQQYMEGHHAIPIYLQDKFKHSLDVYANIVCLCPICHRLLHYGIEEQKVTLLNQIYEDRKERLAKCGIEMSKNEFIEIASVGRI